MFPPNSEQPRAPGDYKHDDKGSSSHILKLLFCLTKHRRPADITEHFHGSFYFNFIQCSLERDTLQPDRVLTYSLAEEAVMS